MIRGICPFDGATMEQQPGFFTVCGPDIFGTFVEFACLKCGHKIHFGGFEGEWEQLGCDCEFCGKDA